MYKFINFFHLGLRAIGSYFKSFIKTSPLEDLKDSINYKEFDGKQLRDILIKIMQDPKLEHPPPIDLTYAHTADTFMKMNLIYKKFCSHTPVILMGETGCGKSYLITQLVENIIGDILKRIDLHAGIKEKNLLTWLDQIVQEAKNIKSDQFIWLFLDEINTCESLGLITELLVRHSYLGKSLPKNIYVICACNPFK